MDRQEVIALLRRYVAGQCSETEKTLVERAYLCLPEADAPLDEASVDRIGHEIWQSLPAHTYTKRATGGLRWWIPYAAAMLIAATAATWVFFGEQIVDRRDAVVNVQDIAPGGHKATLTLADGRTIDLSEEQTGIVVGDEIMYFDGSAVLSPEVGKSERPEDSPHTGLTTPDSRLLTLTTPKGGTYQITLPDGTKVWLNAASTLKYPGRFAADERVVELEGEAYFEVRKSERPEVGKSGSQKTPFRVVSKGQTVEVLGTSFNISAYPDDPETKTTLVEGSVEIVNRQSEIVNKLRPGEQSVTRGATTDIHKVDTDQYTAWRSGLFDFTGKTLHNLMPELARWYDIEVAYEGTIRPTRYVGKIFRNNNLSEVLNILETAKVGYRLEGRKLIITNN